MRKAIWTALGFLGATAVLAASPGAPKTQSSGGVALSENFDEVTAPALPSGWLATNAQGPDRGPSPHREIASGCGNGDFCPTNPNTRGQMVNSFGLQLYGP
jgi:hypothetical protein